MAGISRVGEERILRVANGAFLERGPGASLSLIAGRLRISKAALVERIGTKRKLMEACLAADVAPVVEALLLPKPDYESLRWSFRNALCEALRAYEEVLPQLIIRRLASLDVGPVYTDDGEEPPRSTRPLPERLRRALAARLELMDGHACGWALADGALGSMEARCIYKYIGVPVRPVDDDEYIDGLIDDLLRVADPSFPDW